MAHFSDFLVIGGGIAGLSFALDVAAHGKVTVLCKREPEYSSTSWAQGGIAAVREESDEFELHVEDTLRVGEGLCNRQIVELVVQQGPAAIQDLITRGVNFDQNSDQTHFHLHQEAGHSRRRIFHSADATGHEIQRALLHAVTQHPNIQIISFAHAVDLLTTHKLGIELDKKNRALGAYVLLPSRSVETFLAHRTLVATGGAGKVYLYTSNPDVASGDGIAMCYRAGCHIANMEFFQFHPTCLFHPEAKSFLITEAMRGEGALLRRQNGERFMQKYHPDAELAPRDTVARAIDFEMKSTGDEYVLLDITHREPEFIRSHFPNIYRRCLELGFDITREPIPVVPAAHYCCGGVVVDEFGRTDIADLYAAGECTSTGLHGANRLASNSLLEGAVFARRASEDAVRNLPSSFQSSFSLVPDWDATGCLESEEQVIITQNWEEIRRFMWNYVGIVRSDKRLDRALRRCENIQNEIEEYYWNFHITPDLLELRNLSVVAHLVIRSAIARKESRGLHYTIDHPQKDSAYLKDTIL